MFVFCILHRPKWTFSHLNLGRFVEESQLQQVGASHPNGFRSISTTFCMIILRCRGMFDVHTHVFVTCTRMYHSGPRFLVSSEGLVTEPTTLRLRRWWGNAATATGIEPAASGTWGPVP